MVNITASSNLKVSTGVMSWLVKVNPVMLFSLTSRGCRQCFMITIRARIKDMHMKRIRDK